MKFKILLFLSIFCQTLFCQTKLNKKDYYKIQLCSSLNENIDSELIVYYNSKNETETIRSFSSEIYGHYRTGKDSVKIASIYDKRYFPRIIEINYPAITQIDAIYLKKIENDSMCLVEAVYLDSLNKINFHKSKIAIETYSKFVTQNTAYKFKIVVNKSNFKSTLKGKLFLNEIIKKSPSVLNSLSIEERITNNALENDIYLKAIKQKK